MTPWPYRVACWLGFHDPRPCPCSQTKCVQYRCLWCGKRVA